MNLFATRGPPCALFVRKQTLPSKYFPVKMKYFYLYLVISPIVEKCNEIVGLYSIFFITFWFILFPIVCTKQNLKCLQNIVTSDELKHYSVILFRYTSIDALRSKGATRPGNRIILFNVIIFTSQL